ncbi:hypothetical protein PSTG_16838 [Puccinia striiformis f. sp. tritici PST-78]|uniref:HAT C-terminal dimerisation domain-containing protein n=1 Tax=Puccinia striiformis f. sp. tritici PST-78 TaxID=1165861 RepID=A0A0L0URI9_9BASI|nr:hypothetical protein PSTG_16838 [Puccinia striiformis f. sp. tritici PST-78]
MKNKSKTKQLTALEADIFGGASIANDFDAEINQSQQHSLSSAFIEHLLCVKEWYQKFDEMLDASLVEKPKPQVQTNHNSNNEEEEKEEEDSNTDDSDEDSEIDEEL